MNTLENRLKFLEHYFVVCREHGYYIDAVRSVNDLRVVSLKESDRELFHDTKNALMLDVGFVGPVE